MSGKKRPYALAVALLVVIVGALLIGRSSRPKTETITGDDRLLVVATTGMIADVAAQIAGDQLEVIGLMGPGVDPHLYRASQGDVRRLDQADLVLYNGLGLEGRMAELLQRMERIKPTVAVTDRIPVSLLKSSTDFGGLYDPHIWFDVSLWMHAVERIRDALIEIDPAHAEEYRRSADAYLEELASLHTFAKERFTEIPEHNRVLVTAHDAFGYLGDAYGLEVVGLQGISTDTEVGLKDIQDLVSFLVERGIKAVFVESSLSPRSIEAVVQGASSRGHQVRIGGELFSDALGEAGTPEGTYIGMVKHNVNTIVESLK